MKTYPEVTVIPADEDLCWSADGEDFSADSLGELIDQAGGPIGPVVYLATKVRPDFSQLVSADDVTEGILARAADDGGEYGDDWANRADVSKEGMDELERLLAEWAKKHMPPITWYNVEDIRQYMLTQDDVIE